MSKFSIEKESVKCYFLKWVKNGRIHGIRFLNEEDAVKYYKDNIYGAPGVQSYSLELTYNCYFDMEVDSNG